MTHQQNNALFINSLLSSKEILLDQSNNIHVTEISVFKQSKKVIPLDLVESSPKTDKRPDIQWILFAMINLLGTCLFASIAYSNKLDYLYFIAGTFGLLSLLSLAASWQYKTIRYTYRFKDTGVELFRLNAANLEAGKIQQFVAFINQQMEKNAIKSPKDMKDDLIEHQFEELQSYNQHVQVLYDEGILDEVMLVRIQQRIDNKIFGEAEVRQVANVIPLPVGR